MLSLMRPQLESDKVSHVALLLLLRSRYVQGTWLAALSYSLSVYLLRRVYGNMIFPVRHVFANILRRFYGYLLAHLDSKNHILSYQTHVPGRQPEPPLMVLEVNRPVGLEIHDIKIPQETTHKHPNVQGLILLQTTCLYDPGQSLVHRFSLSVQCGAGLDSQHGAKLLSRHRGFCPRTTGTEYICRSCRSSRAGCVQTYVPWSAWASQLSRISVLCFRRCASDSSPRGLSCRGRHGLPASRTSSTLSDEMRPPHELVWMLLPSSALARKR